MAKITGSEEVSNMKILILGGDGMLGHQLYQYLVLCHHDVRVTLRENFGNYERYHFFDKEKAYCNIDVENLVQVLGVLKNFEPDVVINCIGLIKQRPEKENVLLNLNINAVFPHQLSLLCKEINARLVHMSTDCVFDGKLGGYSEEDLSNAEDVYGKTKFLGELHESHTITLRTSIIGFELKNKKSLLEWVLSQKGRAVSGFRNAIFSGFTTHEMARIIERIITQYPREYGLYNVASNPVSKYDLLCVINQAFDLNLTISEDIKFKCFRQLNGERFNTVFNYTPPSWNNMIAELALEYKRVQNELNSLNV